MKIMDMNEKECILMYMNELHTTYNQYNQRNS